MKNDKEEAGNPSDGQQNNTQDAETEEDTASGGAAD
jgi:hypothetical protein